MSLQCMLLSINIIVSRCWRHGMQVNMLTALLAMLHQAHQGAFSTRTGTTD